MNEKSGKSPAAIIRPILLLVILGTIGYFVWKNVTRREDYTGGDIHTTGTIEAVHVQLSFRVAGTIDAVPVSEGDMVAPGQVVARLDDRDFQVQLTRAEASLEAGHARVAEAKATLQKASRDLDRIRPLVKSGAAPQQQMDAARAAYEVAEAQVKSGDAQVHEAESTIASTKLLLSYTELRSPENGQVSEKIHYAGEMVTLGSPVVAIAEIDTVKVKAAVDETRVGAVRPGDPVTVKVYTFDNRTFQGIVTDITPAGEFATRKDWGARRRDIRTFTVTAAIPNGEHLLKDGMTAEVTITVDPSLQKLARTTP